jgi:hypothetical protein
MRDHAVLPFENMNGTDHSIEAVVCAIKFLKPFKMEDVEMRNGMNFLRAGFCRPGNEPSVYIKKG